MDPHRSWLVGDILDDIEAGNRAGCRTVLIDNGNETEWFMTPNRRPHHRVFDLAQAAQLITAAVGETSRASVVSARTPSGRSRTGTRS
jgi:FMN phosphatase YigB (HAD superfamily)